MGLFVLCNLVFYIVLELFDCFIDLVLVWLGWCCDIVICLLFVCCLLFAFGCCNSVGIVDVFIVMVGFLVCFDVVLLWLVFCCA